MGRMSVHMYEILRGVRSEVSGESSLHHSNLPRLDRAEKWQIII